MKADCIGISMTNTSPLASPTRSKEAALGTNPISVGAPAEKGDGFVLDMATTAVAVGKVINVFIKQSHFNLFFFHIRSKSRGGKVNQFPLVGHKIQQVTQQPMQMLLLTPLVLCRWEAPNSHLAIKDTGFLRW